MNINTVSDLIQALQNLPQDLPLYIKDRLDGEYYIFDIRESKGVVKYLIIELQ